MPGPRLVALNKLGEVRNLDPMLYQVIKELQDQINRYILDQAAHPSGGASPLTTKGDLFGFDTDDARIPVGADGKVLSADSTKALGVDWKPAGGVGTVTSVGTTAPITGGPIVGAGTIGINDFVASGATHARGAVPDPGAVGGTTKFLREDATFAVPPGTAVGTVTQVNTTAPITGGPITGSGAVAISDFVASGASHARGAVPDPGALAGTTKFLREDASWQTTPGSVQTTKGDLAGYDTVPNRVPVGADDTLLFSDSTKALGLDWKPQSYLNRMVICRPAGVIDDLNRLYVLPTTPVSPRILLWTDKVLRIGGVDYYRSGRNVYIVPRANPPQYDVVASYWGPNDNDTSGPEDPPVGTADTWSAGASPGNYEWTGIAYGGPVGDRRFVAVGFPGGGGTGQVSWTTDGNTWTLITSPGSSVQWRNVIWSERLQLWISCGTTNGGESWTSPTGTTWTIATNVSASNAHCLCDATLGTAAYIVVVPYATNVVNRSTDTVTWSQVTLGWTKTWVSCVYIPERNRIVAVAADNTGNDVMISDDNGASWSLRATPTMTGAGAKLLSVCWSPLLHRLVAVGNDGVNPDAAMYSDDFGDTWTQTATPINGGAGHNWGSVVWSNARLLYVAVGSYIMGIDTKGCMVSPDGATWGTESTTPSSNAYALAVSDTYPDLLVAVGDNFSMYSSA